MVIYKGFGFVVVLLYSLAFVVKGNFLRGNVFLLGLWLVCFLQLIRELWPWPWFMVFCGVFFTLVFGLWPVQLVRCLGYGLGELDVQIYFIVKLRLCEVIPIWLLLLLLFQMIQF